MKEKTQHTPKQKGLSDAELVAKYDNGNKIDFDKVLQALCTTQSGFGKQKSHKPKR